MLTTRRSDDDDFSPSSGDDPAHHPPAYEVSPALMPYATKFHDTMLVPPRWFDLRVGPERIGGVDHCQVVGLLLLLLLDRGFGTVLVAGVVVVAVVVEEKEWRWWWMQKELFRWTAHCC